MLEADDVITLIDVRSLSLWHSLLFSSSVLGLYQPVSTPCYNILKIWTDFNENCIAVFVRKYSS